MIVDLQATSKEDWVYKVRTLGALLVEKGYQDVYHHLERGDSAIGFYFWLFHSIILERHEHKTWCYTDDTPTAKYEDFFGLFNMFE